jgi:hypothetical protein
MPLDLQELFATQAAWQRGRARLSWPEKIRMAGLMREAAAALQHRQWLWRPARLAPLPHSPPAALPPPARATLAQDSGTDPFRFGTDPFLGSSLFLADLLTGLEPPGRGTRPTPCTPGALTGRFTASSCAHSGLRLEQSP